MFKRVALTLAIVAIAGCAQQTFKINEGARKRPAENASQAFYFFGINQTNTTDAAEVCDGASKVARIETQLTAANIAAGFFTFGVYTPRDARIYCVAPSKPIPMQTPAQQTTAL